jgi:hypothetical protein
MISAGSLRRMAPEGVSAVVAAVAAAYVARGEWSHGFPLDDAWIHMVYGLELARDHALAYNDGVSATGATSPLWAMFAGLAHVVTGARAPSMAAVVALKVIGILFHAIASALAARCARVASVRASFGPLATLGGGLLVAACPLLAYAAASGMEVSLASTLLLGALLMAARRRTAAAGVVLGLAIVARPESAVVAPIVLGLLALRASTWRNALARPAIGGVIVAALAGVLVARNLAVSGRPLSATFYAKAAPAQGRIMFELRMERGFGDLLGGLGPTSSRVFWILVALAIAAGVVACGVAVARRARGGIFLRATFGGSVAVAGIGYAAATSWMIRIVSADLFYYQRYLAPAVPLLIVGATAGASSVVALLARAARPLALRGVAVALRWVTGGLVAWAVVAEMSGLGEWARRYEIDVAAIDAVQVAMGRFVAATVPAGGVVWSMDAGAIRYWGEHVVVDLGMLNTPDLFRGGEVRPEYAADTIVVLDGPIHVVSSPGVLERVQSVRDPSQPPPPAAAEFTQVAWRCRAGLDGDERRIAVEGYPEVRTGWCATR